MRYHRRVKFSFLLLLILSFAIFALSTQEASAATTANSLSITVYDPYYHPIYHAYVNAVGPESHDGYTDANGIVTFSNIRAGNYMVSVSAPDYPTYAPLSVTVSGPTSRAISFGFTKAYFAITPSHPMANEQILFNGSASISSGNITSYQWNFGDGSTGTGVMTHHTYALSGSYLATLTITSSVGSATYVQTVIVRTNVVPPILATILLVFVLPMLILLLYNRRQPPYIIIQATKPECLLCHGYTDCDCDGTECKMSPC
jgi:PKD repeat protein